MEQHKPIQAAFGSVLRTSRRNAGLSQEALALDCGLDRTYISLLERGLRQPTLESLFALGRSLQVAPHQLVKKVEDSLG